MSGTLTDAQLAEAAARNFYNKIISDITVGMAILLGAFESGENQLANR